MRHYDYIYLSYIYHHLQLVTAPKSQIVFSERQASHTKCATVKNHIPSSYIKVLVVAPTLLDNLYFAKKTTEEEEGLGLSSKPSLSLPIFA